MDISPQESAPVIFTEHQDSILCCDIYDKNKLVITGGVDDKALVWNFQTKQILFECKEHKESVNAVGFNICGDMVASGDLAGIVQVRGIPSGQLVADYSVDEITWLSWHKSYSYVLIAGTISGDIWMWNVKDQSVAKVFPTSGFSSVAGLLSRDQMQLISGYSNGSVKVFDLKTTKVLSQSDDTAQREIISMNCCNDRSLFAIGFVDSTIKIMSSTACKVVATLKCETPENLETQIYESDKSELEVVDERETEIESTNEQDKEPYDEENCQDEEDDSADEHSYESDEQETNIAHRNSVESVCFSECGSFLVAANISGTICIWDTASFNLRYEKHTLHRLSKCILENKVVITAGLDGIIRIYNLALEEISSIHAHQDQILDLNYSSRLLITTSDDHTCFISSLDTLLSESR